MKELKHWQDPINAMLGLWVVLSPWVVGFQGTTTAMSTAVILGIILIAVSLGATFAARAWEDWLEGIVGVLLIIAPWVLGFSMHHDAMMTTLISGIVILVLALWTLLTDKDYSGWAHKTAH